MTKNDRLNFPKMKLIVDILGVQDEFKTTFPEASSLYLETAVNYKMLYELEKEKVAVLREQMAKYGNQTDTDSGQ